MVESKRRRRALRGLGLAGAVVLLATACVTDLTAKFGDRALVQAVNNHGVMAGYSGDAMQPARFAPDGTRTILDPIDGVDPTIDGINDTGEIVGTVNGQVKHPGPVYPTAWDADGHTVDLRAMIPHAGEAGVTVNANDINEDSLVLGDMSGGGVPWQRFTVNIRTGVFTPLPRESDTTSGSPGSINDAGVVVGTEYGPRGDRPMRWTPQGDTYVAEPQPAGFEARDVNNAGDLVGAMRGTPGLFVWKAGAAQPVALTAPADPPNGWYLLISPRITDSGIVVAWAFNSQVGTAVRWRAADAPPELMPVEDWQSVVFQDVNEQGLAIVSAFRDGVRHSLQWTIDT